MKKRVLVFCGIAALVVGVGVAVAASFHEVHAGKFDPKKTNLVRAAWEVGIGCPTDSRVTYDGTTVDSFTDPACSPGDARKDKQNKGLLLAKTGPTANVAAAGAVLEDVPSHVTELGYDLRKAGADQTDPRGSHCGGGAPRFLVIDTSDNFIPIACNSPAPVVTQSSDAWMRLRWTVDINDVKAIQIIFDEGQDGGGAPDRFGLAVLDNIDVNGTLIGKD